MIREGGKEKQLYDRIHDQCIRKVKAGLYEIKYIFKSMHPSSFESTQVHFNIHIHSLSMLFDLHSHSASTPPYFKQFGKLCSLTKVSFLFRAFYAYPPKSYIAYQALALHLEVDELNLFAVVNWLIKLMFTQLF